MDLRHLQAFVAVAEEGTFTKAAQRLHLSQPPLSRQVRHLERELGVTLFVRRRDGVALTTEGALLLERAQAALRTFADFEHFSRSIASRARPLTVGIGWGLWNAVDRIRAHHARRFPDLQIAAEDLCAARHPGPDGQVDVAVTRPPVDQSRYEWEPLFDERFVVLIAASHPLAGRAQLRLADLAGEPLLLYDRSVGPAVYDRTLALYQAAGIQPRIVAGQPPPYAQGAMMLVASGQGYYLGISSPFTQTHEASGVAVVPLQEPNATVDVRIAWPKKEMAGCVREFLRSAREVFPLNADSTETGAA